MKSRRREARELAMKLLYQVEVGQRPLEEVMEIAEETVPIPAEERGYLEDVVRGVMERRAELDAIIGSLASGWRLERIANVDRTILRIALYEIQHRPDVPPSVSVNEAVEIAKKYSTEDSGKFVNGILGSYLRDRAGEKRGAESPERASEDAA